MLEVDDVSSGCPVTNRPVIRLARAGTNVSRVDFFFLFIFIPRIKFVVIKIALFYLNNTFICASVNLLFHFLSLYNQQQGTGFRCFCSQGGAGVRSASTGIKAAEAIVGSLLCCGVSIVQCLFNLLYCVIWLFHLSATAQQSTSSPGLFP